MSTIRNTSALTDIIPFISQLKETFINWEALDDDNRNHLNSMVELKHMELKPLISALEQWDDMQNNGAPGVEMSSVICDINSVNRIVEFSIQLNKIIFNMLNDKNTED